MRAFHKHSTSGVPRSFAIEEMEFPETPEIQRKGRRELEMLWSRHSIARIIAPSPELGTKAKRGFKWSALEDDFRTFLLGAA
jgi:hypothetical protein